MDSLDIINSKTKRAFNLAAERYHDLFHNELKEKEYDRNLLDSFVERFDKNALICDAGCGPSGHIGRYVFDKGLRVIGVDISDKCIKLAQRYNPNMRFTCEDFRNLKFKNCLFDGIISFYSILDTPKKYLNLIFTEFRRILKPTGYLLVAVKAGTTEGYINELLGIKAEVYFTLFTEEDIAKYFKKAGFILEFMEKRNPYEFEINNERIFAIGKRA
ncbi:MAG: class I SAM-dependent methyltransferase [Candidatus Aminicenantes bacterium]|nr:class I SAM-dependent methyltransferase [Candidatus Aminicenantes bacterium]